MNVRMVSVVVLVGFVDVAAAAAPVVTTILTMSTRKVFVVHLLLETC